MMIMKNDDSDDNDNYDSDNDNYDSDNDNENDF